MPHDFDSSALNEHLDGWYTTWPRFAKVAPSSASNPVCVGWFLRSHRLQLNTSEHINTFRQDSGCATLGFDWRRVQDGSKWVKGKKSTNPFAIHIEVDQSERCMAEGYCRNTFSSTNFELSPFGVSWGFIPDISAREMQNSRTALVHLSKCMVLQATHLDHVVTIHVDEILDFSDAISDTDTIRDWLLQLRVTTLEKYVGDRLILSVDRAGDNMEHGWNISYHKAVAEEAGSVARNIPLILRDELEKDISVFCPFGVDRMLEDWTWDSSTRSATSPIIASLESMVQGCGPLLEAATTTPSKDDDTLDTVGKANYDRLNGREDDTVIGSRSQALRPDQPAPVALIGDAATVSSGLTDGTTESKRLQARNAALAEKEAELTPIIDGFKSALDYEHQYSEVQRKAMDTMHSKMMEILESTGQSHHITELSKIMDNVNNDATLREKHRKGLAQYQKVMNIEAARSKKQYAPSLAPSSQHGEPRASAAPKPTASTSTQSSPMDIDLTLDDTPATTSPSDDILEVYDAPQRPINAPPPTPNTGVGHRA